MSATPYLRQRRAVAAKIVRDFGKRDKKRLAEILVENKLAPADLANLEQNTDVLSIADAITAEKLGEPELDTLEELNTATTGERADLHSPDVRADQFEDKLQHPCQETVGVGNMHDGPQMAETLVNIGSEEILNAVPDEERAATVHTDTDAFVAGAEDKLERIADATSAVADGAVDPSPLAAHGNLPPVYPSMKPASKGQRRPSATEDGQTGPLDSALLEESAAAPSEPTDPDGTQEKIAATPVDIKGALAAYKEVEKDDDKLESAGEKAVKSMDRDQQEAYGDTADRADDKAPKPGKRADAPKKAKE